jgi:hypothetical protein
VEQVTIGEYIEAHGDKSYWRFDVGLGQGSDAVIGLGSYFWNLPLVQDCIDRNAFIERAEMRGTTVRHVYTSDGWHIERIPAT